MKIKKSVKYFKEWGLEMFRKFHEFLKYFKVNFFIVHP